ncbi:MAG TPA: signal peptidase II [Candidatus Cloacimonadota bacterium]|jgi:signal peptidase II|nr:signal peptidase II [Candidatus Cloacimonadota bacterium]HOD55003.1 signal peptidase II [Candidatus Cloacimonadota bacterium]HPM03259.1 signal peptidase II [Candidatus Cloacimonadota bacterium]
MRLYDWLKYLWISLTIIILDQITKLLVRIKMPDNSIEVIGNLFRLTHVQNTGAAFSLSFGSPLTNRIVFISISFIFLILLVYIMNKSNSKTELLAYSLVIGGAVGNLLDRIILGSVTDFLDVDFPDFIMHRWPIFNIADSAIVIAITILLIYYVFFEKKTLEVK